METSQLKKFAQFARRSLIEQVSAKLKLVLAEDSKARRENPKAVEEIEKAISNQPSIISKSDKTTDGWGLTADGLIEKVAYTWFNRFCALRFMDVNRYTRIGVVSPAEGQSQPEILAEAKMGYIDDGMVPEKIRQQIFSLLEGSAPSQDPQSEAYRLLVVAICNYWYRAMPFLFERIDDYTELLMPDDLLSGNSILASTRDAMTSDTCQDVEVIGWLYQFYISEKKDEVFAGLKKNKKITPENIPAATQLFTPHWIVRYLVENSLGRLWMLNRPNSKLAEQMDYYIKSGEPETDFLHVSKPEELKVCDSACGSGHMLTYAFDLLYSIYEEEGYEPSEIPEKILTHNLYGIEIDERAGELAAFALTMKARSKQRRFFRKQIQPNICVLKNIRFEDDELDEYMDFIGRDLFTAPLQTTLRQFDEADNFGSLIRPEVTDVDGMLEILDAKDVSGQLFLSSTHQKVLQALKQADYLSSKYHVVIANPPYMGGKGMNGKLAKMLKDNYPDVKSDLFSAFIVRNTELALPKGQLGFMSPFVWMFISSYEKLRSFLINQKTITSLVQLEYSGFDGATVPICTFTVENSHRPDFKGGYVRLSDFRGSENQGPKTLEAINNPDCGWFYRASATDFKKIPGSPIAYWASEGVKYSFANLKKIREVADPRKGLDTGENERFLRIWFELALQNISFDSFSTEDAIISEKKWFPINRGGGFKKWFGNSEYLIHWKNNGQHIKSIKDSTGKTRANLRSEKFYFRESVTWGAISSALFSARLSPPGGLFGAGGYSVFADSSTLKVIVGFFASSLTQYFLKIISPTLNFEAGNISSIPFKEIHSVSFFNIVEHAIKLSKIDWDSYETSWGFTYLPLLQPDDSQPTLKGTYQKLRAHWEKMTLEMQRLEVENNHIFIDAYGLQDELTSEVPLKEITLTCNPHYRYGGNKSEEELEALLLADTMREFASYAVGCMFGRYSLDAPGLILANQGDGIDDYHRIIQEKRGRPEVFSNQPSVVSKNNKTTDDFTNSCQLNTDGSLSGFQPDKDNVIPILDGDWFTDDITERFFKFLRVTFGEKHYEENLDFIETAIGKSIRNYFLKHFYNDHVKRYKKRPIYWLFSSPKGSFNALIYMHRYRSDTVSVVLNDYLREFGTKLTSRKNQLEALSISASANKSEKTRALKEIEKINKMIDELDEYEREVLYPLATEQVEIDLDDGVKVNYNNFGKALKKIPGLTAKGN